jgi:exopolyphosphatase / guanosine-5'-triphosphate,3'-diphosphate pyrophosphatase
MNQTSSSSSVDESAALPPGAPVTMPLRVAGIDVGSNAIRFVAAEFSDARSYRIVAEQRVPVRLGHDAFLSGRLAEEAMGAAVSAFAGFARLMEEHGIAHYRAVATSAVRESRNGEAFVERLLDETGLRLQVVTGAEEARLVYLAVGSRIALGRGRWVLVDLGGGSVEVSLVDADGILWSESHTMGSVRLLEELSSAGAEPGRFRKLLGEYTATLRIPSAAQHWRTAGFIATGGNIESLARLAGVRADGDGVSLLPVAELRSAIDKLSRLSYRQRMDQLGLRADRADVILPAAMVYLRVAELARAEEILAPHVGVKHGLLLDLVADLTTHREHEDRQEQEVYSGALLLGRRFMFDEAHAVHVAALAMSIFEQTQALHGLTRDDRRILLAAALLHDIGAYIAYRRHHKHSQYIIAESELPGFTPGEIQMVANVSRYHRKGEPSEQHPAFMALSAAERERVVRLSALLRVADALDREHLQRVQRVHAELHDEALRLRLESRSDVLLERWALQRKSALFHRAFGVPVQLGTES